MQKHGTITDDLAAIRTKLLGIILPTVLLLLLASELIVLIVNPPRSYERTAYSLLIALLFILGSIGFVFLCMNRYKAATLLTIAIGVLGPWGSLVLDPNVGVQDLFPLVYVTVPVLLSSTFLTIGPTIVLAVLQLVGLVYVMLCSPVLHEVNWPSLIAYVCIVTVIGVMMNGINVMHMRKLQESAIHDFLTGLFNRRFMQEALDRKLLRGNRRAQTVGLIIFDIDRFKMCNDTHGHGAGDAVLQAIAEELFELLDLSSIACRIGGDEFAIIIPEASEESLSGNARLIGESLPRLQIHYQGKTLEPITISQGLAMFPRDGETATELMLHADSALMQAKREGRNRFVVYRNE